METTYLTDTLSQAPKGIDASLLLFKDADVSTTYDSTTSYSKGSGTPVNSSTWVTEDDICFRLSQAYIAPLMLSVCFNKMVWGADTDGITIVVKQKRLTTDTISTAPVAGCATITAPSWSNELPSTQTNQWYSIPLAFKPFEEQDTRTLFVTITPTGVTLETATAYLSPHHDLY